MLEWLVRAGFYDVLVDQLPDPAMRAMRQPLISGTGELGHTISLQSLAARVVELTGLTGILRIDFLSDGTDVYVNEVNSIPGALALYLWPDTPPAELLLAALEEAERGRPRASSTYEVGVALRAAGGIAGKLAGLPQQPRG